MSKVVTNKLPLYIVGEGEERDKLELSINKTQKRVKSSIKKPKQYLNNNLKQLVKIAKFYNKNGRLKFSKFEQLARDENILDRKFQIHFNHACHIH